MQNLPTVGVGLKDPESGRKYIENYSNERGGVLERMV